MKKHIIIISVFLSLGIYAQGQVNSHALGLRGGGDGDIIGGEISYQRGLNDVNRIEYDLGWGGSATHNRITLVGIYHWDMNINGGLNWYIGPGGALGLYSYDNEPGYFNIALGGQVGLEYDFNSVDVPFLLSIDARPMWDFLGDNSGLGWGAALGLRYTW